MARLILKSPYLKYGGSNSVSGYLKYIGTRERVELLPDDRPPTRKQEQFITKLVKDFPNSKELDEYSDYTAKPTKANASTFITRALEENWSAVQQSDGYMKYIATRPRAERLSDHGLFGDEDGVDLEKAIRELDQYTGNVWTHIISLKREDATRLGYNNAKSWMNLLRANRNDIAAAMNIPPNHFRWYAAYHNEGDHPHVHMMAWSTVPEEAYLTKEGIRQIKSRLMNQIFKQEMLHTYEQKSQSRDELVREARRAIRRLTREMAQSICSAPEIEQKMEQLAGQLGTVKGTLTRYQGAIRIHINPHLGGKPITQVTGKDVQKLYDALASHGNQITGKGLASSTIRGIHSMLHEALDAAKQAGLIPWNPTEEIPTPKFACKVKQILTDEQLDVFMAIIQQDDIWHDFFYTELTTGLRRGEICGLKWTDFNEADGTLKVRRTVHQEKGGKLTTWDTKTAAGTRTIILPPSTAELLRERKKSALTEWIFPNPLKPEQPTRPGTAYNRMKSLLKAAGLPDLRFHDLRHTFATHALTSGVDVKTLSGILGHTRSAFTLDTYTHTTGDMQRRAAEIVETFLTDIFGEELRPWEESARAVREPSA